MKRSIDVFRIVFVLGTALLHGTNACLTPDDAAILNLEAAVTQLSVYQGMLNYAETTVDAPLGIFNYTAPKQVRTWLGVMSSSYTAMAWHQKNSLDFLSRTIESNNYRRCDASNVAEQTLIDDHAKESFAYTYLWAIQEFIPEWTQLATDYATTLNLDLTKCATENEFGCGLDTPYGLARFIVSQYKVFLQYDGWNADASMSLSQYSWQYQEFRDSRESTSDKCTLRWKPANELCEIFDIGMLENVCWTPQEFQFFDVIYTEKYLMQHMASSGRSYFLGDDYICNTKTQYPCYDLVQEARNVITTMSANRDDEKAEVEFFDNVFRWFTEINDKYWASSTKTQFEIITGLTAAIASMYEATLLVWKDKLRHGVIRPRTVVNADLPVNQRGWKPYVMDNPTAEYPSHVACMCSAYTRAMRKYASEVGTISPSLSVTLAAGSSTIEANKPENDVVLTFDSWASILEICNDSRLNSGNHFSKAASEAEQLCGPVGPTVVDAFENIVGGRTPSYTIDYNLPIYYTRCKPLLGLGNREQWSDPNGARATALSKIRLESGTTREANNNNKEENPLDKAAQDALKKMEDLKEAAREQAQKLKELGKIGTDGAKELVDGAVDTVTGTLDDVANGAVDVANEVGGMIDGAVSGAVGLVSGMFGGQMRKRNRLRSRRRRKGN